MIFFIFFLFSLAISFSRATSGRIVTAWFTPLRKKNSESEKYKFVFLSRSRCESCKQVLSPLALMPVFGWILKCLKCGQRGSPFHPIIEFSGGVFGVLLWEATRTTQGNLEFILFSWLALIITWIIAETDAKTTFIPMPAIVMLLILGITERWDQMDDPLPFFPNFMWFMTFVLLYFLQPQKLGLADVWLVFALGLLLHAPGTLYLPTLSALTGIFQAVLQKKRMLPFAPHLVGNFLFLRLITAIPEIKKNLELGLFLPLF